MHVMFLSPMPCVTVNSFSETQWENTMAIPKWQASFFQEREWLPLYIKDLTKILLHPYQIHWHWRRRKFEGQLIGLFTGCLSPWGVSRGPKYLQDIKPDSTQSCLLHSLGSSDLFLGFLILFAALVLPLHLVAIQTMPTAAAHQPIKTVAPESSLP